MFDARLRPLIDPALNRLGRLLARLGVTANLVTLAGAAAGVGAGAAVAGRWFWLALGLIVVGRLLDGLDGAVARATRPTDFGGFLDILSDYVFYVGVPIGFALADPANMLAALLLVASFTLTAVSFLAFASIAARRGVTNSEHGPKSFLYSTGLAEGAETILAFVLMCVWPAGFRMTAVAFAALCLLTVGQRTLAAYRAFPNEG